MQRAGDIILLLLQLRQGHVGARPTEFSTPRIARGPGYLQVGTNNILQDENLCCSEFILCCFDATLLER